jgi:precorrin-6A/cobalt-precorrin-6A reductase
MVNRVLILGGTTEAYALATALVTQTRWHVITSLAGRTHNPRKPDGELRIGGFGGVAGLVQWLAEQQITAVIDATHPFAKTMGWHVEAACRHQNIPLLRLERPPWQPEPTDRWQMVATWSEAVACLEHSRAQRIFLALGRQELEPFTLCATKWFLIRCVTPPQPMPAFQQAHLHLARGPFSVEEERTLLMTWHIDCIVCKNSGGEATIAKLIAARERGLSVIMRSRPARPAVTTVTQVSAAVSWLHQQNMDDQ